MKKMKENLKETKSIYICYIQIIFASIPNHYTLLRFTNFFIWMAQNHDRMIATVLILVLQACRVRKKERWLEIRVSKIFLFRSKRHI